jgi:hypothetical protein
VGPLASGVGVAPGPVDGVSVAIGGVDLVTATCGQGTRAPGDCRSAAG